MVLQFPGRVPEGTPERFYRAMKEMTSGYQVEVQQLFKTFENSDDYNGLIVSGPIDFDSLCEHHLLPFEGQAFVGYLPGGRGRRIVGLSKLARLVDAYARRLQVQERLTQQIAQALLEGVAAKGVGVRLEARHLCQSCRGVRKPNAIMRTQALLGCFKRPEVRAEFDNLCRRGT